MITLHTDEILVAVSMRSLASNVMDPIARYLCLWSAFDNVYTTISEKKGHYATPHLDPTNRPTTRRVGGVDMPRVDLPQETEKLRLAFEEFPTALRKALVLHPSVGFFAYRTPRWRGRSIPLDAKSQRLTGVINVGHTVDAGSPVWSPISTKEYVRLLANPNDSDLLATVSEQILWLLYTVRNNSVHGGKRADDADDVEVAEKAASLLNVIVDWFAS